MDHCPHLRAHPDQERWRSADAKVAHISCSNLSDHFPYQVPGHPYGLVNAGLLGLPGVRVNVRGESPSSTLPHPQVSLVSPFLRTLTLTSQLGHHCRLLALVPLPQVP